MMDHEHELGSDLSSKSKPEASGSSGNGSVLGDSTSSESQSLAAKESSSQRLPKHKGTGPRTKLGKQIASRNSTKHGVFSSALLLPGESPGEYRRLLAGKREAYQPEGEQEELVVKDLTLTELRRQRLRLAEYAITRKNMEFFEWDQRNRAPEKAGAPEKAETPGDIVNSASNRRLIQEINNPDILKRCLQMLSQLQEQIAAHGFNQEPR